MGSARAVGLRARDCASGPHGMASWPLAVWVAWHRAGEGGQGLPPTVFPGVQRGWAWAVVRVAGGRLAWLPVPWGTVGLRHVPPVPNVPLLSAPPAPMSYDCPCGACDVLCWVLSDAEEGT